MLRNGLLPGKSLPVPSPEGVFVGLKVKKRKSVSTIAQKGPQKSLSLAYSTHPHLRLLLKELRENRKNSNRNQNTKKRYERSNELGEKQTGKHLGYQRTVK
jgi:hypothetical protein